VTYVQNVTDVDDPLLERADRDGEDWRELADREIARYRGDMEALRVLPPGRLVGAVEALPLIDRMNQVLADRGALYEVDSDVYFSRATDPQFGAVSHLGPADMLALSAERGGDPGRPGKKDPLDCLVWLAARPGEPSWGSGFGPGRPGWHVECAAIATHYLGPAFDVQAGGSDLIFPHHECSASHARVAFADGHAFARCYTHAGMVRLDGEKMSKSLGNLVFVSRLVAGGVDPMAIRLAIISHHYREDWDWTDAGLAAAQDRLAHWRAALHRAGSAAGPAASGPGSGVAVPDPPAASGPGSGMTAADVPTADSVLAAVRERIADDLDAPGALAAVDRWASAVTGAAALPPGTAASAEVVRDTVDALLGVAL
jgi:L-cysteine:1D-myo-inositol 2-amino-2-deoxy-alpha-D-glucopyranoside ligase